MVYYWGQVITRNNRHANIFGLNLYPVPKMQLNDEYIYYSQVFAVLTEFDPTLNMYTFEIDLND